MMRSRRWLTLAAVSAAFGCLFVAGCGSNRPAVQGTVLFNGEPVDGGAINFIPQGDVGSGTSASAEIVAGKYYLPAGPGPRRPGKPDR